MIRNPNRKEITESNPWFFWYTCIKCKMDFRREKMWRLRTTHSGFDGGKMYIDYYVCGRCAVTQEDAYDYFYKNCEGSEIL